MAHGLEQHSLRNTAWLFWRSLPAWRSGSCWRRCCPARRATCSSCRRVLIASALGGWRPGIFRHRRSACCWVSYVVMDARASSPADLVNAVAFALLGIGISWRGNLLYRFRRRRGGQCGRSLRARSPPAVDSRHHSRRHDRHRRARHHTVVQRGGGTAVRLWRRRCTGQECQRC